MCIYFSHIEEEVEEMKLNDLIRSLSVINI